MIGVLALLGAVAVRTAVLIALAAAAARGLRRASAATRHVLWSSVFVGILAIAATAPRPPSWTLSLGAVLHTSAMERGISALAGPGSPPLETNGSVSTKPPARRSLGGSTLATVAVGLWATCAALLVLRLVVGWESLRRLTRRGWALSDGPARKRLDAIARLSPAVRRVRLIESDGIRAPATWGIVRPVIALPASTRAWSATSLDAALRHELAHVIRQDVLTQLLADACCALLWFHPAVWYAARRMRVERERACDDAVLAQGPASADYAEMLVAVARGLSRSIPTAVGMTHAGDLDARVRAILDPTIRRRSSGRLVGSVVFGVLAATAGVAGLDVLGSSPASASVDSPLAERIPVTPELEAFALHRGFAPHDEREAVAFEMLRDASRHLPQHEMDFIRDRAIWALATARDGEVVAPLLEQLGNADWRVRAYAAWCLDLVGAREAREPLAALLRDPVWRVRAMAAAALVHAGDVQPTAAVVPLLEDPNWQVRAPAVQLLALSATPEAIAAIRGRLDDPHIAVRRAAQAALDEIATP